jgi:hypothetical protein
MSEHRSSKHCSRKDVDEVWKSAPKINRTADGLAVLGR